MRYIWRNYGWEKRIWNMFIIDGLDKWSSAQIITKHEEQYWATLQEVANHAINNILPLNNIAMVDTLLKDFIEMEILQKDIFEAFSKFYEKKCHW